MAISALGSRQGERCLSMELRITSSLRMQAVRGQLLRLTSGQQALVEVPV